VYTQWRKKTEINLKFYYKISGPILYHTNKNTSFCVFLRIYKKKSNSYYKQNLFHIFQSVYCINISKILKLIDIFKILHRFLIHIPLQSLLSI
jgi:hypothetical protein